MSCLVATMRPTPAFGCDHVPGRTDAKAVDGARGQRVGGHWRRHHDQLDVAVGSMPPAASQ